MNRGCLKVIRKLFCAPLCALACLSAVAAQAADTFPRLAGIQIGNPHNYESPAYQAQIAKLNIAILSYYPGWEITHRMTMEEVARRIKAINPNTKIFLYYCPESTRYPSDAVAYPELGVKLDAQKWWLYQNSSGPTKVLSDFGNSTYILNLTQFSPADTAGKKLNQWLPQYAVDKIIKNNPTIDGMFTDNVFWKPRRNGDWNRDGTIDDQGNATVQKWYREGNRSYLQNLKALMPGKTQLGNIADWGDPVAVLTEYNQLLPGGVMEQLIGKSWSVETWAGWSRVLSHYRKSMAALAAPKLGIFNTSGVSSDYQSFRYAFATALLDDGYFSFNDSAAGYSGVPWFDEYDVKLGGATKAPPAAAWQGGVWRRDFANGIALVNPKGNGPVEITLERDFRKVTGTQDRAVNNGQRVRTVTLRDRDGIILLNTQRRPRAPGGVRIDPPG